MYTKSKDEEAYKVMELGHVVSQRTDGIGFECTCGKIFPLEKLAVAHANEENEKLDTAMERRKDNQQVGEDMAETATPAQYAQVEEEVKASTEESPEPTQAPDAPRPKRGRPAKKISEESTPKVESRGSGLQVQKPQGTKVSLQTYLRSEKVQDHIDALLKDKARTSSFVTSLMTAVNSNAVLQDCEPNSVITAALTAAAMSLDITPSLGFAHIVPYKEAVKDGNGRKIGFTTKAQFQIGWRGFVQLALRTQRYKYLNVGNVREGEYGGIDRRTGETRFDWVDNESDRNKLPVIGYFAYLELKDGFTKTLYMTNEELKAHAKKYSKSYQKGYGKWIEDFPVMAAKTVVKLLIGKYGPMSTDIVRAILSDQAVVGADDSYDYIDNRKNAGELPGGTLADTTAGENSEGN